MTQIVNLPALTTLTNSLVFPAADTSDGNRTKKVSLAQLATLSTGPQGPQGIPGIVGPSGPSGPSGPGADQSLNTGSSVTFQSVTIRNTLTGITFGDASIQTTAYKRTVQNLTTLSSGDVTLTAQQITAPIITADPVASGRNLYLPTANSITAGLILIIKNRNSDYSFNLWGGLATLGTVPASAAVEIACDGFNWFRT